jgi:hypothetical protein
MTFVMTDFAAFARISVVRGMHICRSTLHLSTRSTLPENEHDTRDRQSDSERRPPRSRTAFTERSHLHRGARLPGPYAATAVAHVPAHSRALSLETRDLWHCPVQLLTRTVHTKTTRAQQHERDHPTRTLRATREASGQLPLPRARLEGQPPDTDIAVRSGAVGSVRDRVYKFVITRHRGA